MKNEWKKINNGYEQAMNERDETNIWKKKMNKISIQ